MLNTLHAEHIKIDGDEDGFELVIVTEEVGTIRVNIQSIVLEFESEVRNALRGYALEAEHARASVARGESLSEYLTGQPDVDEDAYALDDPKSPGYFDRMAALSDSREGK